MTLSADVRHMGGGLLVTRGQVVNDQMREHLVNLRPGTVNEPLHTLAREAG
jgi:hypothetical protein